ncbi:hypothetical protein Pmani_013485 [Petrolisthes manimaculis]|uniref:Uncharacterized protein n=1 Tax=Petrolisthes manimaculis TaxID=1843537 RepID=A0AAE1PXI8_9EUCA|nr:hypothetical protein Pmani_013485 [Petrolisthes manimaculis]
MIWRNSFKEHTNYNTSQCHIDVKSDLLGKTISRDGRFNLHIHNITPVIMEFASRLSGWILRILLAPGNRNVYSPYGKASLVQRSFTTITSKISLGDMNNWERLKHL